MKAVFLEAEYLLSLELRQPWLCNGRFKRVH